MCWFLSRVHHLFSRSAPPLPPSPPSSIFQRATLGEWATAAGVLVGTTSVVVAWAIHARERGAEIEKALESHFLHEDVLVLHDVGESALTRIREALEPHIKDFECPELVYMYCLHRAAFEVMHEMGSCRLRVSHGLRRVDHWVRKFVLTASAKEVKASSWLKDVSTNDRTWVADTHGCTILHPEGAVHAMVEDMFMRDPFALVSARQQPFIFMSVGLSKWKGFLGRVAHLISYSSSAEQSVSSSRDAVVGFVKSIGNVLSDLDNLKTERVLKTHESAVQFVGLLGGYKGSSVVINGNFVNHMVQAIRSAKSILCQ